MIYIEYVKKKVIKN